MWTRRSTPRRSAHRTGVSRSGTTASIWRCRRTIRRARFAVRQPIEVVSRCIIATIAAV